MLPCMAHTISNRTTTDRVLISLSPIRVTRRSFGLPETFQCSYESRLRLKIEFVTDPTWDRVLSGFVNYYDSRNPSSLLFRRFSLPEPRWARSLTARIPISPQLRRVICRLRNEYDEVVAEVFATISLSGQDALAQASNIFVLSFRFVFLRMFFS